MEEERSNKNSELQRLLNYGAFEEKGKTVYFLFIPFFFTESKLWKNY